MRKLLLSAVAAAALTATPAFAQVSTTPSSDANALGSALAGSGFNLTGATLTTNTENGTFTGGTVFGINQGVVLTTGTLGCVGSTNTSDSCTGSGHSSSLQLTFTLDGDSLFFNYVFASEEYNEYVGSGFNDGFQLLLNGPGFTNVNLAQLPGGGGPVTINNVNAGTNSGYYNNNDPGPFAFSFDGFTDVLTASATGLTAGATYTLTFNIFDVGDSAFDSAVFIQGGSIGNVTPPGAVPEPATWAMMLLGFGLAGSTIRRRRQKMAFSFA